jgi:TctA family transporter
MLVIVTLFSLVGSFALQNSMFDVYIMIAFGVVGYYLERNDVPLPPLILGLIRTQGDLLPFVTRPVSAILAVLLVVTIFGGPVYRFVKNRLRRG